jgi:hypothetical protein
MKPSPTPNQLKIKVLKEKLKVNARKLRHIQKLEKDCKK